MNNRRKLLVVLGAGALAAPLGVPFGISVASTGSADWATRSAGRKLARRLMLPGVCTVRMREVIVDVNPIPSPSLIQQPISIFLRAAAG